MIINYSRVQTYQTCPRLYYWRFVQSIVPPKEALPLIIGRAVHAGLAAHYSKEDAEPHIATVFQNVRESAEWLQPELDDLQKQQEYCYYVLHEYEKQWAKEPFEVLAPEVEGKVPIGKHTLMFRTDAVVSWKGHVWLLEHKTSSIAGPAYLRRFRLDGQITTYTYAVWQTLQARPVGAIINVLQKGRNLNTVSFLRDVVMRPEQMVTSYIQQLAMQCDLIEALVKSEVPPSSWFMHTQACAQFNRTCDYIDLCTRDTPDMRSLFIPREHDYVDKGEEA